MTKAVFLAVVYVAAVSPNGVLGGSGYPNDEQCYQMKVPAFDFSDRLETTQCVETNDQRIAGFKMALYVRSYEFSGSCDMYNPFKDTSHLCDMYMTPPYILFTDNHRLDFTKHGTLGAPNKNQVIYTKRPQGCIVEKPRFSPCPNFTVVKTYFDDHDHYDGSLSEEIKSLLSRQYDFFDVALYDHEHDGSVTLVREAQKQYLMEKEQNAHTRYKQYKIKATPCLKKCNFVLFDYVVEFAYILKPEKKGKPPRVRDTKPPEEDQQQ